MLKKFLAVAVAGVSVALFGPAGPASATQTGSQSIYVLPNSQSGISVQFNCGTYGVNPGYEWGENRPSGPACGANPPAGDREPVRFLVGSRWCAERHLEAGYTFYNNQYINGGPNGAWVQAWQSWASGTYKTVVRTFPAGQYAPDGSGYYCSPYVTSADSAGAYYEN